MQASSRKIRASSRCDFSTWKLEAEKSVHRHLELQRLRAAQDTQSGVVRMGYCCDPLLCNPKDQCLDPSTHITSWASCKHLVSLPLRGAEMRGLHILPASSKAQKILGSRFRQRCDLRRKGGVIKGSHTFFLSAFTKSSHTCTHI